MHRQDNSKYLLFIEPNKNDKSSEPIEDIVTQIMAMSINKGIPGTSRYSILDDNGDKFTPDNGWRGFHITECGEISNNCEYLLENGMITNSLATFYLTWYRHVIPAIEMNKVNQLVSFYKNKLK